MYITFTEKSALVPLSVYQVTGFAAEARLSTAWAAAGVRQRQHVDCRMGCMEPRRSERWYRRWSPRARLIAAVVAVAVSVILASALTEVLWGCDGNCSLIQCSTTSPCITRLGKFTTGNVCGLEGTLCDSNLLWPDCYCRTRISGTTPSCACRVF